MPISDDELRVLARRAGLELVLERFPQDVAGAAEDAALALAALAAPADPADEAWPPMRVAEDR